MAGNWNCWVSEPAGCRQAAGPSLANDTLRDESFSWSRTLSRCSFEAIGAPGIGRYRTTTAAAFFCYFRCRFFTQATGMAAMVRGDVGADLIRFCCLCWLFLLHGCSMTFLFKCPNPPMDHFPMQGHFAVDGLFFLTGMFFYQSQSRTSAGDDETRSALGAVLKRIVRLSPLNILVIAIGYISGETPNSETFVYSLLFIQNLLPFQKIFLTWTWSLAVDVQSHALLSWAGHSRRRCLLLLGLSLAVPACWLAHFAISDKFRFPLRFLGLPFDVPFSTADSHFLDHVYTSTMCRIFPVLLGVIYSSSGVTKRLLARKHLYWPTFLFGILLLTCAVYPSYSVSSTSDEVSYSPFFSVMYGALARPTFALGVAFLHFSLYTVEYSRDFRRIFTLLGTDSYAFFLVHPFVIGGLTMVFPEGLTFSYAWYLPFMFCVMIPSTCVISHILTRYVQVPLQTRLTKLVNKLSGNQVRVQYSK